MAHWVVVCDKFCGQAVMRVSDIFVMGAMTADAGIGEGGTLAVYVVLFLLQVALQKAPEYAYTTFGQIKAKLTRQCLFLGLSVQLSRSNMFKSRSGVAVRISSRIVGRVGLRLPLLNEPEDVKLFLLKNLSSIVARHALCPKQVELIFDMCLSLGGKASHLASLVAN